ncbi:MAG: imelysin [Flavobacteriaceae bacterium]|jgi:uncharacterized iron-regulated protein|nr:imelysin [Flavobacteriaceae bacterium]
MRKTFIYLGISLFASNLLINCSDNEVSVIDDNSALYKEVLTNEANVITSTYVDLAQKAQALKTAVDALEIGDDAALQNAKDAWVAARKPWEQSEAFLFGPVEIEGIDPAIDSWPVNVSAINTILNSGSSITQDVIETNNETRGFHTLEYYLWGNDGTKTASQLTAREIEYLKAVASDLSAKTDYLSNSWSPSGGNYSNTLISANNTTYPSQKSAIQELVEGMISIADEVASNKIAVPFGNGGTPDPEQEESRFSKNSLLDFADNIRSIQNIYFGTYGTVQGKGLTDIIAPLNSSLDATVKTKIAAAISAIEAVPISFTDAIYNNKDAVENAEDAVLDLQDTLEKQLIPFISNNL